ncbi:MAG: Rpn family recombination-promoting nuclease/putative transposase [Archangium sp.]
MGAHDKIFRGLMKEPGVAETLVRERLPRGLVKEMSGTPVLLSESFVESTLKGSAADVVMKIPLKHARELFVYCVVEHKRSESKNALVQVLRYVTALYVWLERMHTAPQLPPVIPFIIYNGTRPWRGPTRFRHTLDERTGAARHSVDFAVQFLDVSREPMSTLSKHPTLKGGLLGLRAAATTPDELPPVLDEMLSALKGDVSTRDRLLFYLSLVLSRPSLDVLAKTVKRHSAEEPEMETIAQYLERKGFQKGQRDGEKKALRVSIRRVMTQRFKKLPEDLAARLEKADRKTLNRWFDLALTAKTAREVFDTP